jgi:hypothetical protein
MIPEAKDMDTLLGEVAAAPGVARLGIGGVVLPAVDFDGQARGGAVEVEDVVADRVLAAEAVAVELSGTQLLPEPLFGVGLVLA